MSLETPSRLTVVRELPIGVEVGGDLSAPLSDEDRQQLLALFRKHHLLLFRNQSLSPEQHRSVALALGPVPEDTPMETGVNQIALDGLLGTSELSFHSDLSFAERPHFGVSLHAIEIEPEEATSTEFVDAVRACRTLPDELRQQIVGLEAQHIFPADTTGRSTAAQRQPDFPTATRSVIWDHHATGEPILYVNYQATARIVGLPEPDSDALLEQLFAHLYAPANRYSHLWRTGDVIFWDNRALQHARGDQSKVVKRTLQRLTLDEQTFMEQFGDFITRYSATMREDPALTKLLS
ncbi:MAG: taurine dioxygenase [Acidimicrobiales bacterium]|nr:taurine dioxygenase [Acidimicrobiales bacterium]